MSDLFVTVTAFVVGLSGLIVALIVGWGIVHREILKQRAATTELRETLQKLHESTEALHKTTVETNKVIEVEKIRNTKIEAKANTAADKVEAVAVQADANRQELMMIRVIMEEWQEDRNTIAVLKEELRLEKLKRALRWWQRGREIR